MASLIEHLLIGGNLIDELDRKDQRLQSLERRTSGEVLRVYLDGWRRTNVAAGLTASTVNRYGSSDDAALQLPVACTVTGLLVALNAPRTAGSLTVALYVGGSVAGLTSIIDDSVPALDFVSGSVSLEPGEEVTVRLTSTGAWSPTTADLKIALIVEL